MCLMEKLYFARGEHVQLFCMAPPPPPAAPNRRPISADFTALFCQFVRFLNFADLFCRFVGFL